MNNTTCDFDLPPVPYIFVNCVSICICAFSVWLESVALLVYFTLRNRYGTQGTHTTFMTVQTVGELTYSVGLMSISVLTVMRKGLGKCEWISVVTCAIIQTPLQVGFALSICQDFFLSIVATYSVISVSRWIANYHDRWFTSYSFRIATVSYASVIGTILVSVGSTSMDIIGSQSKPLFCVDHQAIHPNWIRFLLDRILFALIILTFLISLGYISSTKVYYHYSNRLSHFRMISKRSKSHPLSQWRFLSTVGIAVSFRFVARILYLWFRFIAPNQVSQQSVFFVLIPMIPVVSSISLLVLRIRNNRKFGTQFRTVLQMWCGLRLPVLASVRHQKPKPAKKIRCNGIDINWHLTDVNRRFPGGTHQQEHFIHETLQDFLERMKQPRWKIKTPFVTKTYAIEAFTSALIKAMDDSEAQKMWYNDAPRPAETQSLNHVDDAHKGASELHVDLTFDIPLSRMILTSSILGAGAYGAVTHGYIKMHGGSERLSVAIKSPLDGMAQICRQGLQRETTLMMYVGRHVNVLKLLGTILDGGRLCAVLEYCEYSSLKDYLSKRRIYFRRFNVQPASFAAADAVDVEAPIDLNSVYVAPGISLDDEIITEIDLLFYAYQIANGMEFLVANKIIHRDVALRNMLLTDLFIVKVSDFGLARRHEVSRGNNTRVPFKWHPPEAIISEDYTRADIWSFGVVLWEVFSLGYDPWPCVETPIELWRALKRGKRLEAPDDCPNEAYDLMLQCWTESKDDRPSFGHCKLNSRTPQTGCLPNTGKVRWNFSKPCPRNCVICFQEVQASTIRCIIRNTKKFGRV